MSVEKVEQLLRAVADDDAFAAQVATDPAVIQGYGLTLEERTAILAGDLARLRELGVADELVPIARTLARPTGPGTSTAL